MNITVYLSSKSDINPAFEAAVEALGKGIGEMKARLVYGGSNAGQMHRLAVTAKEHGATVTGIIPEVFRNNSDPIVDEMIYTLDLSERKARMIELGQVFVALPGGIGTVDEVMSTLAVLTVNRMRGRKIILVNVDGVFQKLYELLQQFVEIHLAAPEALAMVELVDTAEAALEAIKNLNR